MPNIFSFLSKSTKLFVKSVKISSEIFFVIKLFKFYVLTLMFKNISLYTNDIYIIGHLDLTIDLILKCHIVNEKLRTF